MTKKELEKECQRILYSYDKVVSSLSEFQFLLNLFKYHPEWEHKSKGKDIVQIEIGITEEFKTKCFYIIREDGTKTDISFKTCINGKPSKKQEIKNACRNAIEPIIFSYKNNLTFPIQCSISGKILHCLKDVHIDHYNEDFDTIANEWIKTRGGEDILFQQINKSTDNCTVTCFTNNDIKQDFIEYHNKHTHLRVVDTKVNLSILKIKSNKN